MKKQTENNSNNSNDISRKEALQKIGKYGNTENMQV